MDEGELGAVLCALAGPRRGDAVAAVGAPAVALRALLAAVGATAPAERQARLVLTGDGDDDDRALALLAPGGRLVGLAGDRDAAVARVARLGLTLRHVEPVGERVAWSAVSTASP